MSVSYQHKRDHWQMDQPGRGAGVHSPLPGGALMHSGSWEAEPGAGAWKGRWAGHSAELRA